MHNHFYYIDGPVIPSFNFNDYVGSNKVSVEQFLMQNTWVQKENGAAVQYSIEQAFDSYKTLYGIDSSEAFSELKKLSPVITRSFILAFLGKEFNQKYRNGFVHKHFHAPEPDSNNVYVEPGIRRTITVAIPTKIIDEVTEQVCWQEFDYDFVGKTPIYNGYQNVEWQQENLALHDTVTKIDMPKPGQYLVLDFIASHTLHWVENSQSTNNEFIFLVQDI
jgi:hypothetical protein